MKTMTWIESTLLSVPGWVCTLHHALFLDKQGNIHILGQRQVPAHIIAAALRAIDEMMLRKITPITKSFPLNWVI